MIPKNKFTSVRKSIDRKREIEESDGKKPNSSSTGMFFKALEGQEKVARYEMLLLTPPYALPKYKDEFTKDASLTLNISLDHHSMKIGKNFYSIPCKRQTIDYDFATANKEKDRCPVCTIGYNLKKKYYDERNALIEEHGSYDAIPEDFKSDLKQKRLVWYKITNKKPYDYLPCIFVKVTKDENGDKYEIADTVKWFKVTKDMIDSINEQVAEDNYVFAEDYTEDGEISYGNKFKPSFYVKLKAEKEANPYYSTTFINNNDYVVTRKDDGTIVVVNEKKGIDKEIGIPDVYAYFENTFADWEGKTMFKKFAEELNADINDPDLDADNVPTEDNDDSLEDDEPTPEPKKEAPKKAPAKKKDKMEDEDTGF